MDADAAHLGAEVNVIKAAPETTFRFTVNVPSFDTFNGDRKILLNMETSVRPKGDLKKTFVMLLISPLAYDATVWKELHTIGKAVEVQ